MRRMIVSTAVLLTLAGCSSLHSNAPVTQVYLLQPPLPSAAVNETPGGTAGSTLAVLTPLVAPGLNTERIALVREASRLDYYAASRWPAELPQLLQPLLIDALRAGGRFRSVQTNDAPFSADLLLQVEVRRFAADFNADGPGTVRIQLVCTLGRRGDRATIASFAIETSAQASANRMSAVVAAFNQALGAALQQLVEKTSAG